MIADKSHPGGWYTESEAGETVIRVAAVSAGQQ